MENSIREVFTLLKYHQAPHFYRGALRTADISIWPSLVSTAPETFGIVSCQFHSFTLQCILASFSIVIPCFPGIPNWCKTASPAPRITPMVQDGLCRRGTRWPKAFPALCWPLLSEGMSRAVASRTQNPGLQECPHCHHLPQTGSSQQGGFPQETFFRFHLFFRKKRAKSKNSHYVHNRTQSCSTKTLLPGTSYCNYKKKTKTKTKTSC